jgi:hypothetical protein
MHLAAIMHVTSMIAAKCMIVAEGEGYCMT